MKVSSTNGGLAWVTNRTERSGRFAVNTVEVTKSPVSLNDAGIYSVVDDASSWAQAYRDQALIRFIVSPAWSQTGDTCNGRGYFYSGKCVCHSGLFGDTCQQACGGLKFGPKCEFEFPAPAGKTAVALADLGGTLVCLPDPYGCVCVPGWSGSKCDKQCPPGKYGADCQSICSCPAGDQVCSRYNGRCTDGTCLLKGYSGPDCDTVCTAGKYGVNCEHDCHCFKGAFCDRFTGDCPGKCAPGWQPQPTCDKECAAKRYGQDCSDTCHCNQADDCHHVTGPAASCACEAGHYPAGTCDPYKKPTVSVSIFKVNPDQESTIICIVSPGNPPPQDPDVYITFGGAAVQKIQSKKDAAGNLVATARVAKVAGGEIVLCRVTTDAGAVTADTTAQVFKLLMFTTPPALTADVTSIKVTLSSCSYCSGDGPAESYRVCYRERGEPTWKYWNYSGPEVQLTNLTFDTAYEVAGRVKRAGPGGWGPCGPIKETTTLCDRASAVRDLSITASTHSLTVTWKAPSYTGTNGDFDYEIEVQLTNRDQCYGAPGTNQTIKVSHLAKSIFISKDNGGPIYSYSDYTIAVVAKTCYTTEYGVSVENKTETFAAQNPTAAPVLVTAQTVITSTSSAHSFSEIPCGYRHGPLEYRSRVVDVSPWARGDVVENNTEASLDVKTEGLTPYSNYNLTYVGVIIGSGVESPQATFTTTFTTKEAKPRPVNDTISLFPTGEEGQLEAEWRPPVPPHARISHYILTLFKHETGPWSVFNTTRVNVSQVYESGQEWWNETVTYPFGGLQHGFQYRIEVIVCSETASVCSDGRSSGSQTMDDLPPERPDKIEVTGEAVDEINIEVYPPGRPKGSLQEYQIIFTRVQQYEGGELIGGLNKYVQTLKKTCVNECKRNTSVTLTGLVAASRYNISISGKTKNVKFGASRRIQGWTSFKAPPPQTEIVIRDENYTETTVEVYIRGRIEGYDAPVWGLRVLVEQVQQQPSTRKRRSAAVEDTYSDCSNLDSLYLSNTVYTAAQFDQSELKDQSFVIGDNKTHGSYDNTPLVQDETYKFYLVYIYNITLDNLRLYSCVIRQTEAKPVKHYVKIEAAEEAQKQREARQRNISIGSGVGVAVLLVLVLLVVFLVMRKRRQGKKPDESRDNVPMREVRPAAPSPPVTPKPSTSPEKAVKIPADHPLTVKGLWAFMAQRDRKFPTLKEEFETFTEGCRLPAVTGNTPTNKGKNRYKNIVAYDHSRVKLCPEVKNGSDYVNATYIDGFNREREYIASQAPNKASVNDFWRLVWQEGVVTIAMVTRLVEDNRRKSILYWPDSNPPDDEEIVGESPYSNDSDDDAIYGNADPRPTRKYGDITVLLMEEEEFEHHHVRIFRLTHSQLRETRTLTHYNFLAWPDKSTPNSAADMLEFRDVVVRDRRSDVPLLVHCSAGVGRTGTLILLDILLQQAKKNGGFNVPQEMAKLRDRRMNMIQTQEQYVFVYDAMLERLYKPDTCIRASQLRQAHAALVQNNRAKINKEFQIIELLTNPISKLLINKNDNERFVNRRRNAHIIPVAGLMPDFGHDRNEYVNAVKILDDEACVSSVVTEVPTAAAREAFWLMLQMMKYHVVVLLTHPNEFDKDPDLVFWPKEGSPVTYGPITITNTGTRRGTEALVRSFTVTYPPDMSVPQHALEVRHYTGWGRRQGVPYSSASLMTLLQGAIATAQSTRRGGVVFMCLDGYSQSGVLAVAKLLSDSLSGQEGEPTLDMVHMFRLTRKARPQFITSLEQYSLLYSLALDMCEERAGDQLYANTAEDQALYANVM